jgi:Ca-activated chloride channel homolog
MKSLRLLFLFYSLSPLVARAWGDAGVLIPSSETDKPDSTKLSLADMQVSILVDNQNARVSIRQIFASHVGTVLEGQYLFAINPEPLVSDFGRSGAPQSDTRNGLSVISL